MGTTRQGGVVLPYLSQREMGYKPKLREKSQLSRTIYTSMSSVCEWDPAATVDHTHHGSVFNLGYSTDGSVLAAACERRSVLLFDPHNGHLIGHNSSAHKNCVNCVKFLDTRTFVTCSDDMTVALWDCRNLSSKVRSLQGHQAWVKNVEYCSSSGLLLSSGFDGNIFAWDINDYSRKEKRYRRVFYMRNLMRSQLSPDQSQLIVSSSNGSVLVVNNLDLSNLWKDVCSTKKGSQEGRESLPGQAGQTSAEPLRRNNLQLISDFPADSISPASMPIISSLAVHPQGWCILTRSTSRDESAEWSCVHDIQPRPEEEKEMESEDESSSPADQGSEAQASDRSDAQSRPRYFAMRLSNPENSYSVLMSALRSSSPPPLPPRVVPLPRFLSSLQAPSIVSIPPASASSTSQPTSSHLHLRPMRHSRIQAMLEAIRSANQSSERSGGVRVSERLMNLLQEHPAEGAGSSNEDNDDDDNEENRDMDSEDSDDGDAFSRWRLRAATLATHPRMAYVPPGMTRNPLPQTISRLPRFPRRLFHCQEPNVGRGFIKEQCFSTDGRVICSPYDRGVRLLSFNPDCDELCDCVPSSPTDFHEVTKDLCHARCVVTTAFSPTACQFVSGCLGGKIVFHQPVF